MSEEEKKVSEHPLHNKVVRIISTGKGSGTRTVDLLMEYYRDYPHVLIKEHDLSVKEAEVIIKRAKQKKFYG